jgi:hypothetical protein
MHRKNLKNRAFFEPPKAIGPRERCPRGPIYSCFMRL